MRRSIRTLDAVACRARDVAAGVLGLVVLTPVLLVLAVLVACDVGFPVIFRQARPGRGGRLFVLYKFRTMRGWKTPDGKDLPDAQRLTAVGRWMRSWSLDELPELYNVLRGDMSLVGPRPLLPQYLERYTPRQALRHLVRPGITGWAQVNGRNAISWEEKFNLDVWYVENRSFRLDLSIIARTIRKGFAREGINAVGEASMPEFKGSPSRKPEDGVG